MGLNPDPAALHKLYPDNFPLEEVAPSYIDALYDQKIIEKRVFSFVLKHEQFKPDISYMDFGYIDYEAIESPVVWTDVVNDEFYGRFWW